VNAIPRVVFDTNILFTLSVGKYGQLKIVRAADFLDSILKPPGA